ncbi:hypothetical protein BCR35DRAFT_354457 [Leucosporidium creatinivorum]|uniref:Uncharacterized protein n=1 Tax=Leucosporidium creatinivorum TaxID=106004 RepID=A0A1Y2EL38_9BASI|nr:hypothetical protein BCR35DRAFT_354457 [Leucosporidium creatinivorum]
MEGHIAEAAARAAATAAADWSTGTSFSSTTPCSNVWAHDEHQDLQVRYTKALEDLSAARQEVIRLTVELSAAKPPRQRAPRSPAVDLNVNSPDSLQHAPAPLHPRPILGPLPSQPPDPIDLVKYHDEISNWVRPVYAPEQISHITNFLSSQAVVTNLRHAMVDLNGQVPSQSEWKLWCADRLVVVRDILDPGRTWRQQQEEHKRLAVAVMEKRWPTLTLCEDDVCWKASQFLSKRLDEVIKLGHQGQKKRLREGSDGPLNGLSPDRSGDERVMDDPLLYS